MKPAREIEDDDELLGHDHECICFFLLSDNCIMIIIVNMFVPCPDNRHKLGFSMANCIIIRPYSNYYSLVISLGICPAAYSTYVV